MNLPLLLTTRLAAVFGTAVSVSILTPTAIADYPSAVQALNPNHYYRLDETSMGAVADTGTGPLIPGTHEGSFPPAEVGATGVPLLGFGANNKALFDNNAGGVNLGAGSGFATDIMSIAMWFQAPGGVQIGDRLFTNNVVRLNGGTQDSFQMVMTNGASGWSMAFATGNEDPQFPETMQLGVPSGVLNVQDNQWHHVVVVRNGDDIRNLVVVIDGVDLTALLTPTSAGWGTTGSNAHLGLRADNGGSDHNHNGSIDDTAIWLNRALTVEEAQGLYNAALTPPPFLITGINLIGNSLALEWNGGGGPFVVQMKTDLADPDWIDVATTDNNAIEVDISGNPGSGFYRVVNLNPALEAERKQYTGDCGTSLLLAIGKPKYTDLTNEGQCNLTIVCVDAAGLEIAGSGASLGPGNSLDSYDATVFPGCVRVRFKCDAGGIFDRCVLTFVRVAP